MERKKGGGVKKTVLIMFGYWIPLMGQRALSLVIFFYGFTYYCCCGCWGVLIFHFDCAFLYVSGKPLFGTLIALLQNGTPVRISSRFNAYNLYRIRLGYVLFSLDASSIIAFRLLKNEEKLVIQSFPLYILKENANFN